MSCWNQRLGALVCALLFGGCTTTVDGRPDSGGPSDLGGGGGLVPVVIEGEVLLANGYPGQILPLFRAEIASGSALGRVELFARFCSDAACATPIAVVPLVIDGADANGRYVLASADTSGNGFAKPFTIAQAPLGASFLQIIGDTQFSAEAGLGECSSVANCPADFDVLSIGGFMVGQNVDGTTAQPAPATVAVNVTGRDAQLSLPTTFYLGHLLFDRGPLAEPAPADDGTLVMAVSNADDTFRNLIGLVDLSDASATPGALSPSSYTLQKGGTDFVGDVCGLIRGGDTLYAVGIDNAGANIFRLSATTGLQLSDTPLVTIPPTNMSDPTTYPRPCRGVFGSMGGVDHLYLLQFSGAGSSITSHPYPFYDVDVTNSTYATPIVDTDYALRAIAVDGTSHLFAVDMSWSKDSDDNGIGFNRILELTRDASGNVTGSTATTTNLRSDEQCGAQLNWPSGAAVVSIGGSSRLLVGHDTGVAVYDPSDLTQTSNLLLPGFGQLFTELVPSLDGTRLYAQPQCKAVNSATTFRLPYAQTTENADTNLIAILDLTGSALAVANTSIDIDGNGTFDHGIDLDFWFLKRFIRDHSSTLPIPPVVFTGPQLAVGETMVFVRGSGIQGNGSSAISSSGMGQVQDVGFFSLATGRGVVFGDYIPWTDGLSSEAGTGTGIWGYDVHAGQESSVGALMYLPAP
ncbi:MAG: hypothetical protein H6725_12625 [Sandaracinaceae bacterium]|nr:hypothetical protein [Sandaracinaceae bacterium]